MELFHPDLPGVVVEKTPDQIRTARASGWRDWDELSGEQQQAHEDAVAEREAEQAALLAQEPPAKADGGAELNPETTEPPVAGDTTKE